MACARMVRASRPGASPPLIPTNIEATGMQWHAPKKAFRPTKGLSSYEQRTKERAAMAQMKAKEKEMKEEKEEERQVRGASHFGELIDV